MRVTVALGQVALRAFQKAWLENGGRLPDRRLDFGHDREWALPGGATLLSSYHPSQQNTQTGKLTRSMFHDVFRSAREILRN